MTETTRRSLDKDPVPHASPQSAQETPDEIPLDETNTPTSTTRDSHDSSVQASLPQAALPSDSLDGKLNQEVLEMICIHQATFGSSIKPAYYITMLKTMGKDIFMEGLASRIEGFHNLSYRGGSVSEGYIKHLQRQCGLIECPRNEQPTPNPPDSWHSICELQRYKGLETNYSAWPHEEFRGYSSVYTAQAFGCLGYTLPVNMGCDQLPNHLALLVSLCKDRRTRGQDNDTVESELDRQIHTLHEKHRSLFPDQHS
ncbi:hypothetical protein MRS44_003789 [Fusarium solani]|uniref:uncharacterized protein n=1 Tax=Fusarium solani TaxID=169388 RepID=UPI0032C47167|nr:hypothetical protein MRS44_003789 [Fusarium solani]